MNIKNDNSLRTMGGSELKYRSIPSQEVDRNLKALLQIEGDFLPSFIKEHTEILLGLMSEKGFECKYSSFSIDKMQPNRSQKIFIASFSQDNSKRMMDITYEKAVSRAAAAVLAK